jgi:hypothetical protein
VSAADAGGRGEPDIEALRALLDKATPRPWAVGASYDHYQGQVEWPVFRIRDRARNDSEAVRTDALLIEGAVNALPSLLASLAAARAERDAAVAALRFYADPASWEGRDDYIEGEHVERFDPEAFDDKGTRARAALAPRASEPAAGGGK